MLCCLGQGVTFPLGLCLQLFRLGPGLCKDLVCFGLCLRLQGVPVDRPHRSQIVIGGCLRSLKHMVQFQSGLCNGPGTVQMDLPLFQFGGQICIFGFELIFALLERKDDLDQFSAAHMPQFTVCHNGTSVSKALQGRYGPCCAKKRFSYRNSTKLRTSIHTAFYQTKCNKTITKMALQWVFKKYFLKIAHKIPQAAQKEHPARKTGCSFCGRMFTS